MQGTAVVGYPGNARIIMTGSGACGGIAVRIQAIGYRCADQRLRMHKLTGGDAEITILANYQRLRDGSRKGLAETVGTPLGDACLVAVGMPSGKGDHDAVVVSISSSAGHLPAAGGAVGKLDGHAAAVDVVHHVCAGSQLHQATAAHIRKCMASVDGNAFLVSCTGDSQVLVAYIHYSAGIFPVHAFCHRQYNYAGAGMGTTAGAAIIVNGDGLRIAHGIHCHRGIADGAVAGPESSIVFHDQVGIVGHGIDLRRNLRLVVVVRAQFRGRLVVFFVLFCTGRESSKYCKCQDRHHPEVDLHRGFFFRPGPFFGLTDLRYPAKEVKTFGDVNRQRKVGSWSAHGLIRQHANIFCHQLILK